jgi:CRISPR-associated protein Cas2
MMQYSVYSKLVLNSTAENIIREKVRNSKPPSGLIQLMTVTEKQFTKIEFISGQGQKTVIDSDERMLVV